MTFPPGIIRRAVQCGPAFALTDGADLGMDVTLTPNRSLVWVAGGTPAVATAIRLVAEPGQVATEFVPVTDQAGWRDTAGNAISVANGAQTHLYTVRVKFIRDGASVLSLDPFDTAVPSGDGSPFDLDLHLPFTGADGVTFQVPDSWTASVTAAQAAAGASAASAAAAAAVLASYFPDVIDGNGSSSNVLDGNG